MEIIFLFLCIAALIFISLILGMRLQAAHVKEEIEAHGEVVIKYGNGQAYKVKIIGIAQGLITKEEKNDKEIFNN